LEVLFREQNWSEAVLRNYSMLMDRKLTWQEFASRCIAYQDPPSKDMPVVVKVTSQEINLQTAFRKPVQPQTSSNPPLNDS